MDTPLVRALRTFGFIEGVSFLVLMGIAMPLKYAAGWPHAVVWVGWAHGLLFMIFNGLALVASHRMGWPLRTLLLLWGSSVVPFGTFVADKRLLREPVSPARGSRTGAS